MKNKYQRRYHYEVKKGIISIDFDGTICESKYPDTGPKIKNAKKYITKLYNEGYGVVINTCRANLEAAIAYKWLQKHDIPFDYFNSNFPHLINVFGADCRKISANVYIDDKQVGGLPPWKEIYKFIKSKNYE